MSETPPDRAWVLGIISFLVVLALLVGGFLWLISEVTYW